MKRQTRAILFGAGILGLASLCVLALMLTSSTRSRPGEETARRGTTEAGETGCAFTRGQRLSYQIRQHVGGKLPRGSFNQNTESRLDLEVMRVDRSATLLAQYTVLASDSKVDLTQAGSPFLLKVGRHCQIEGFARHRDTSDGIARVQQGWVHELIFRWPTARREDRLAQNAIGRYEGTFAAAKQQGTVLLQRRVHRYEQQWGQANYNALPKDSLASIRYTTGPWFDSLASQEVLTSQAGDVTIRVAARKVDPIGALKADRDVTHYRWGSWLERSQAVQNLQVAAPTDLSVGRRQRLAKLRLVTPKQAVASYIKTIEAGATIEKTWPALRDYLEARPDKTADVVNQLKSGEIPAHASGPVYIALGNARTPQARHALLEMFHNSATPVMSRTRAMFSLVDRDDVGVQLAGELSQHTQALTGGDKHSRFFAREAALALGAMAGLKGRADVKQVARATAQSLLGQAGVGDLTYLRPAVGMIANIGDPDLLGWLQTYSSSTDHRVRRVTARAFRRMHPKDTSRFVRDWLARETHPVVKQQIYLTMRRQVHDAHTVIDGGLIDQSIVDLKANPDRITRKSIIRLLGKAAKTSASAKAALLAQIPVELAKPRFGIYKSMVRYFGPEELRAALAAYSGVTPSQRKLADAL